MNDFLMYLQSSDDVSFGTAPSQCEVFTEHFMCILPDTKNSHLLNMIL